MLKVIRLQKQCYVCQIVIPQKRVPKLPDPNPLRHFLLQRRVEKDGTKNLFQSVVNGQSDGIHQRSRKPVHLNFR